MKLENIPSKKVKKKIVGEFKGKPVYSDSNETKEGDIQILNENKMLTGFCPECGRIPSQCECNQNYE